MSHTTEIKTVPIRSISALEAAVRELNDAGINCKLTPNKAPRMYRQNQFQLDTGKKTADYCLELTDGAYDVGFLANEDGTYKVVFDSWNNNVAKLLGARGKTDVARGGLNGTQADIGRLMSLYTKHASIEAATSQGYVVLDSTEDEQGQIHLQIQDFN